MTPQKPDPDPKLPEPAPDPGDDVPNSMPNPSSPRAPPTRAPWEKSA